MDKALYTDLLMNEKKKEVIDSTFRKDKRRLFNFIRKRVKGEAEAEDILQDVFFQFVQNFNPLEPIEEISAWLFRVARNKIIDRYRKKKPALLDDLIQEDEDDSSRNLLDLLFDPNDMPDKDFANSLVWETLAKSLDELPPEQKEVFVLHELEGKDFKEISAMTGVSVNTLLSRKRYAVLHLREKLRDLYNELLNY